MFTTGSASRHAQQMPRPKPPKARGAPSTSSPATGPSQRPANPKLTHFISLPIGHHASLRASMTGFTSALLQGAPAVAGLDRTIVIPARRLHLTLGVMSLDQPGSARANAPPPTLGAARALLEALLPRVLQMLHGQRLRVDLERMDVLQPERGDASRAHVLFVGPVLGGEDGRRLRSVCEMVRGEFIASGLMVDDHRPLKLHCTVLNTTYRKPRPRGARQPFSYADILQSTAFRAIAATQGSGIGAPTA
ncbi:hypothetical protein HETIRDRAFT_147887, partial [Heterobasidion irregulare TC 32-1]